MADWQLNRIGAKSNAPTAVGQPAGFVWDEDKSQHVVYRGADNQIHELYLKRAGGVQDWRYGGPLGYNINAPLAGGDPVGFVWAHDKTQHVIYRGTDNLIYEVFYKRDQTHDGWEYGGPLSAKVGAPAAAGEPSAYAWEGDNTQHIVYRGTDNQIHEVFYKHDATHKGWEYGGAMTSKVGAPPAAGDPVGFAWEDDKTQHFVYRGADGAVHEVFYKVDSSHKGWEYGGALSTMVGAPPAAADPTAFVWDGDKTQHILYRSADGNIQEIFYKRDSTHKGWEYGGALNVKVRAPVAAGRPYGYAWEKDKTQHVIYRTADGAIHEIFYKVDRNHKGWEYGGPLSAKVGAPPAAGDPVGFAWEADGTQHVIYRGQDNYIQELWQRLY